MPLPERVIEPVRYCLIFLDRTKHFISHSQHAQTEQPILRLFTCHILNQVAVCRGTLQLPVPDELEGVTNGSLANIIRCADSQVPRLTTVGRTVL